MSALRHLLLTLSLAGLMACAGMRAPASDQLLDGTYQVVSDNGWTRLRQGKLEVWTVGGPGLEQLRFYSGLDDGDSLFPATLERQIDARQRERLPRYRRGMSAHAVADFVRTQFLQSGAVSIEISQLRPAAFGELPGFSFQLELTTRSGLRYRGLALGTTADADRLHLILFTATAPHHFDRHQAEVRKIFESVELL